MKTGYPQQSKNRRTTAQLFMADARRREPATAIRARKYGTANQLAHEQQGRIDREALRAKVGKRGRKPGVSAKSKQAETGVNSGTIGGSRSLRDAFFK